MNTTKTPPPSQPAVDWSAALEKATDRIVASRAERPAVELDFETGLGDYQDKALAWDGVRVALNSHVPGWASNGNKSGMQSAIDAITALATRAVPAVELERFRAPVTIWIADNEKIAHLSDVAAWAVGEGRRLLALIDGAKAGEKSP